jgi:hypothetical protein
LNSGYHITTPRDIWVYNDQGKVRYQWAWDRIEIISSHKQEQLIGYPVPEGFYNTAFKFINLWTIKTPKEWSCLFVHPLHQEDLPFKSLSAVVDTDKFPAPVNFPFFLKKNFSGLIPKGTPMIQVIPFKRQKFVSSCSWDEDGILLKIWKKAHTSFFQ